jgi:hypothetical protein
MITRVNVSYLDLSDYIRSANMPLVLLWMVTISIKSTENGIIVMETRQTVYLQQLKGHQPSSFHTAFWDSSKNRES